MKNRLFTVFMLIKVKQTHVLLQCMQRIKDVYPMSFMYHNLFIFESAS
jgi:hypothetical protein